MSCLQPQWSMAMAALTVEVWTLCDCFSWSSSWGICFIFLLRLSSHTHKPPFSSFYIFCSVLLRFKSVPAMCRLCILLYLLLLRHREALHLPALHSHPWTILCSLCSFCLSYSVSFISQELEDSESCCLWSICSDPLSILLRGASLNMKISQSLGGTWKPQPFVCVWNVGWANLIHAAASLTFKPEQRRGEAKCFLFLHIWIASFTQDCPSYLEFLSASINTTCGVKKETFCLCSACSFQGNLKVTVLGGRIQNLYCPFISLSFSLSSTKAFNVGIVGKNTDCNQKAYFLLKYYSVECCSCYEVEH